MVLHVGRQILAGVTRREWVLLTIGAACAGARRVVAPHAGLPGPTTANRENSVKIMTRVHKIKPEATMRSGIASAIITGLLVMLPSVSVNARVTGVTFEPKSPIVGHSVTAIATDDQKHKVDKWIWYCTLTD